MIRTTNQELVIIVQDNAPADRRERLLKALAAAFRWYGHSESVWKEDQENLVALAELQDALVES